MEIKTKFNIGDTIYFIGGKRCSSSVVRTINIKVGHNPVGVEIDYGVSEKEQEAPRVFIKVQEQDAYGSREELLQSI